MANKGVRAYNWTTGGTKADLANECGVLSAISLSLTPSAFQSPLWVKALWPATLIRNEYLLQGERKEIERLEITALKDGLKTLKVEEYKYDCEHRGFGDFIMISIVGSISLLYLSHPPKNNSDNFVNYSETGMFLIISSLFFDSAWNYIMRTENLSPRKNCVRRATEKIKEQVEALRRKPALEDMV